MTTVTQAHLKPIVLIGPMGAGKTTIGGLLAKRLNRTFIDSDHELEARTGVTVATIFEVEGEAAFREREAEILDELSLNNPNAVLSTGGGAVLREVTRERLRERGFVVYLHTLPHVSYDRLKRTKDRPILRGSDPLARLEALYTVRHPIYASVAHLTVEAFREKPSHVVDAIVASVGAASGGNEPYRLGGQDTAHVR